MKVFGSGPRLDEPDGDPARQAVAALRGYAYQLYASGLAWLSLPDGAILCLEVAEDYAIATSEALAGTQVRDTGGSGAITLQSEWVRSTIDSYVDMVRRNPERAVTLHYLTTSAIGLERERAHRIEGLSALEYWRRAATGADLEPLRSLIEALDLADATKSYLANLSDAAFRRDFLQRIHWNCGAPGLDGTRADFEAGLVEYSANARRLSSRAARSLAPTVLQRVLLTAVSQEKRTLRRADLLELIDEAAYVSVPIEQLGLAFRNGTSSPSGSHTSLLAPASDLALPEAYAPRDALVAAIDAARPPSRWHPNLP